MRVLILHHLEKTWDEGYKKYGNTSFEELCEKVAEHLESNEYDRVILTQFEYSGLEKDWEYSYIIDKIDDVYDYGYGWDIFSFSDGIGEKEDIESDIALNGFHQHNYGYKVIAGGNHSELLVIDSWMEDLKRHSAKIFLCGAFRNECLEDMQTCLDWLELDYNMIQELCV